MVKLPYTTKELIWLGDTKEAVSSFPVGAKRVLGFGLRQVQNGETPAFAVPLSGLSSGVYELKMDSGKNTFRTIYIAKLPFGVFVLHAFMKKSKTGRSIPNEIRKTIRTRLQQARQLATERRDEANKE